MTDDILIGWDSITSFLKVSRVTAWTWSKKYGMPIILLPSGRVRASKAEIRQWIIVTSHKLTQLNKAEHN